MLAASETFAEMTNQLLALADEICGGRLIMAHEGGYSEVHVPFCGHAVIQTLAESSCVAPDPLSDRNAEQQPNERFRQFQRDLIDEMAAFFGTA